MTRHIPVISLSEHPSDLAGILHVLTEKIVQNFRHVKNYQRANVPFHNSIHSIRDMPNLRDQKNRVGTYQWEFQDPKMEVPIPYIRPIFQA